MTAQPATTIPPWGTTRGEGRARDGLLLHFQPIVDLRDRTVAGVEALARLRQDSELLPPQDFIGQAERDGSIVELGADVLALACREASRWCAPAGREPLLLVNLSAVELASPGFAPGVMGALRRAARPARSLAFEVTETLPPLGSSLSRPNLESMAAAGVGIALDDFGTGYPNLGHLRDLPISGVKIDKRFVSGLPDPVDQAFVRSIRQLADACGAWCVAEGIETEEQREVLLDLGIRHGQGYLLAAPMSGDAFARYLLSAGVAEDPLGTRTRRGAEGTAVGWS